MIFNIGGNDRLIHITITYDTRIAGATITATNGKETHKILANDSGVVNIDVRNLGHWLISEDMFEYETSIDINYYGKYTANIKTIEAVINISYPAGSNCKLTKDNKEWIAPDTSGTWMFTARLEGTYIAYCSNGIEEDSIEIKITDGQTGNVKLSYIPVAQPFSSISDEDLVELCVASDEGKIDIVEYTGWQVGDTRTVKLSAIESTVVGEVQPEQDVELVIMNIGGKTLTNGNEGAYIVGLKNSLSVAGYINATETVSGGWDKCARRIWCNNDFKNAFPESIRSIFKEFNNITGYKSGSDTIVSHDYFALASEKEVLGQNVYSDSTISTLDIRFKWYETKSNIIKKINDKDDKWWLRSIRSTGSFMCTITETGAGGNSNADYTRGISPFGVIGTR